MKLLRSQELDDPYAVTRNDGPLYGLTLQGPLYSSNFAIKLLIAQPAIHDIPMIHVRTFTILASDRYPSPNPFQTSLMFGVDSTL